MATYLSSGCFGDVIYSLPSVQALGAGKYYICDRPWTKAVTHRLGALSPLLQVQPCIEDVLLYHGEQVDVDFTTFRASGQKYGETIISRQARYVRAKIDISRPWLQAKPDSRASGRIVVNRCDRWEGFVFPWPRLVETFRAEILFVGLKTEYESFIKDFGKVDYAPTETLLEVAGLMAAAEMFIGNQSSPLAIAEGLHQKTVVEICCYAPDCFHHRPGNVHYIAGDLKFSAFGKRVSLPQLDVPLTSEQSDLLDRAEVTRLETLEARNAVKISSDCTLPYRH